MVEDGIKSKCSGSVMAPSPTLAAAETLTKPEWARSAGGKNAALITGFVQKGGGKRERARYRKKDSQLHWRWRWSAAPQYKGKLLMLVEP